mmetsp:Transcript_18639/g.40796  ORF Transcript_18639/g.40796 Transcript_18639/m.40796 type:complete len:213 (-) Transcript_18639:339-977(-)
MSALAKTRTRKASCPRAGGESSARSTGSGIIGMPTRRRPAGSAPKALLHPMPRPERTRRRVRRTRRRRRPRFRMVGKGFLTRSRASSTIGTGPRGRPHGTRQQSLAPRWQDLCQRPRRRSRQLRRRRRCRWRSRPRIGRFRHRRRGAWRPREPMDLSSASGAFGGRSSRGKASSVGSSPSRRWARTSSHCWRTRARRYMSTGAPWRRVRSSR